MICEEHMTLLYTFGLFTLKTWDIWVYGQGDNMVLVFLIAILGSSRDGLNVGLRFWVVRATRKTYHRLLPGKFNRAPQSVLFLIY
jgi:hypothetical protein